MKLKYYIILGAVFIILLIVIPNLPIVVIGAGQRGVVFNNATGIENRIMGEGTHWKTPFFESVISMPIQTQATQFDENAGTSDSQSVDIKLTVNWHLDPARVNKIYQNIGSIDAVVSNVLTPNTQDAIKAATSKYVALAIQKNRDNVSANALSILQSKLKKYNIMVDALSITNINFSGQFNAAVEQAQVAEQQAKAAENKVAQAKAEADQAIAQAEGQAKAQQLQQQTLTPEYLELQWINKWNGVLPAYSFGSTNEPLPIFSVNK